MRACINNQQIRHHNKCVILELLYRQKRANKSTLARLAQISIPAVEPRSGLLIPLGVQYAKKKLALSYELFFKYGGEGGIRTPDTLPYTHFPGVLLQPLGHLTKLSFLSCWNGR